MRACVQQEHAHVARSVGYIGICTYGREVNERLAVLYARYVAGLQRKFDGGPGACLRELAAGACGGE